MDKHERSLKAIDDLFEKTSPEEFEKDYLECEKNIGIKAEEYINRVNKEKEGIS